MKASVAVAIALSAAIGLSVGSAAAVAPSDALKDATRAGEAAYIRHDYNTAIARYEQALKLAQGSSPKILIVLYSNLGAAYREAHKFEEAQKAFKNGIALAEKARLESDPSAKNVMLQYANLLKRMGNNMESTVMESRATGGMPAIKSATTSGGTVDSDSAAVSVAPTPQEVKSSTGRVMSLDELKQYVNDHPDNFQANDALAAAYASKQMWSEALAQLQIVERRFPNKNRNVHQLMAFCYSKSGNLSSAISEMQVDMATNPANARDDLLCLHGYYMDQGDVQAAADVDRQFLEKFPNDPKAAAVTSILGSIGQMGPNGSQPKQFDLQKVYSWPRYYFPLKVYVLPVDDNYRLAPSAAGRDEQRPDQVVAAALEAWSAASQGKVSFAMANSAGEANIEISFVNNPNGLEQGMAGLTTWAQHEEHARARIQILLVDGSGKPAPPEKLLSVTLHEIGHALWLDHSTAPGDIMFPQMHGAPLTELSTNDASRLIKLYSSQ